MKDPNDLIECDIDDETAIFSQEVAKEMKHADLSDFETLLLVVLLKIRDDISNISGELMMHRPKK